MSLADLRTKDVVNTRDGKRLGRVMDIEFDPCSGQVLSIVVPGEWKMGNLLRGENAAS